MFNTLANNQSNITSYMESWINEIEADIKVGRNILGPFKNSEEIDKYLRQKAKKLPSLSGFQT